LLLVRETGCVWSSNPSLFCERRYQYIFVWVCSYRKPTIPGWIFNLQGILNPLHIYFPSLYYFSVINFFCSFSQVAETPQDNAEEIQTYARYKYPTMSKTQGNFKLSVVEGEFTDSQIVVMLGENGTGKTTFIRMLVFSPLINLPFSIYNMIFCVFNKLFCWQNVQAGLLKPDTIEDSESEIPEFNVSYKPQKISPKFQHSVRQLLHSKIRDSYMHPQFVSDVMKPLLIEQLMDQEVVNLSGGELQRVALCLCLGKVKKFYQVYLSFISVNEDKTFGFVLFML